MSIQRVWTLLALVLIVASAGIFFLYSSRQTERSLRLQKEQALTAKTIELAAVQSQINNLILQKDELENSLNAKIENLNGLVKEYGETIKARADKMNLLTDENTTLKSEKEALSAALESLKEKVMALEKEKEALALQIETIRTQSSSVKEEVVEDFSLDEDLVSLGSIVVKKSGAGATIQSVNKVYGFIVVDAGYKEGLRKNSVLNILRGEYLIGRAVVQQVRDHLSAAVLMPGSSKKEVRAGDQISIL